MERKVTMKKKLTVLTLSAALAFGSVSTVSAAPFPNSTLITQLNKIHAAATQQEKNKINAARSTLSAIDDAEWLVILGTSIDPLLLDSTEKDVLVDLIREASTLLYTADGSNLEAMRNNPAYRTLIQDIATNANVGVTDLTVNDFVDIILALQTATFNKIASLTSQQLIDLATDSVYRNSVAKETIKSVLTNNTYAISKVFQAYYSESDDSVLTAVASGVLNKANVIEGTLALYSAYQRANTPTPGNPGGGTVTPNPNTDPSLDQVKKDLEDIIAKLPTTTEGDAAKAAEAAVAAIEKAVAKINGFESSMKTTADGKATISAGGDQLLATIDTIAQVLADLKKVIDASNTNVQLPKLNLTLDIGAVTEAAVDFKLPESLVKKAIDAGLNGFELKQADSSLIIPVGGQFIGEIVLSVSKETEDSTITLPSGTKVSRLFDLGVTVNGTAVTQFVKPIQLKVALENLSSVDRELLSLGKIVNDSIEFYGGRVVGNELIEARDTFSTYVVVENKVSFNDVDKVKTWAGRQIDVVAAKGAVEGKAKGKFAPSDLITRAEFAKMLTRALDLDNTLAKSTFGDVKDGHWSAAYVAAAADLGIIQGRSATTFAPTATITRAEMATMIARALKVTNNLKDVENVDAIVAKFSDAADIPKSLKAGVAFAADNSIVIGNAGKFSPNANATRAEAAVILYRAINFTK